MDVLTDADVAAALTPELSCVAMRQAVLAAWRGDLAAPPRTSVDIGSRRLTFTCGATDRWYGYRSYVAPGEGGDDQVVVVHDADTGAVRGVAVGQTLGPRRVGAMGAVALEAMGPVVPQSMAMIGAGTQAWHQLWALPERFRRLPIRVHSRTPCSRMNFAARARVELGLDAVATDSIEAAVDGADIVILATSSPRPALPVGLVHPGAFVSTLGPKQRGRAEFDLSLAQAASLAVSDSPAQVLAYDPPNVLVGSGVEHRLVHLGAVIAGEHPVPDGTRAFFNVGLAGTEAWLLATLLGLAPPAH